MAQKPLAIIPTYIRSENDCMVTLYCVDSLLATADVDVLIIDDGSPPTEWLNVLGKSTKAHCQQFFKASNDGFCSPPDEPILTSKDGYVALGELDPVHHGLVTYVRNENVIRGDKNSPTRGNRGYAFSKSVRDYNGVMFGLETSNGIARVTPNHGVTFQWTKKALSGWCVYLMRRGSNWRIGQTQMTHYKSCFGPFSRKKNQDADQIWILSWHSNREDALAQEQLLAWTYNVPTLQFKTTGINGIGQNKLDSIWFQLETQNGAFQLLSDFGRDPFYSFAPNRGRVARLTTQATNLMPEIMEIPISTGEFTNFAIQKQNYSGEVFSLDVEPYQHYISNGVVVHNSKTVNIGLRMAHREGRDAILVNADIFFNDENWLKEFQNGNEFVRGAKLLYSNGTIQHAGIYYSLIHRDFNHIYRFAPNNFDKANEHRICGVTGALQYITWECLDTVGFYDQDYSMSWEDVDYCMQVFNAGHKCEYLPKVTAIHYEALFRGEKTEKVKQWSAASWKLLHKKWEGVGFSEWFPNLLND